MLRRLASTSLTQLLDFTSTTPMFSGIQMERCRSHYAPQSVQQDLQKNKLESINVASGVKCVHKKHMPTSQ
ncbi:hypothetical protein ILYODFUR_037614, partial [Ilyodon furcidens]